MAKVKTRIEAKDIEITFQGSETLVRGLATTLGILASQIIAAMSQPRPESPSSESTSTTTQPPSG